MMTVGIPKEGGFRTIHMQISIAGALRNNSFSGFQRDDGSDATREEVRDFMREKLALGWQYLPMGDCPTFDPQTGCPGHDLPPEYEHEL